MSPSLRQKIAVIDAGGDLGASVRGASMGPGALRRAGLIEALRRDGREIDRWGNVHGPEGHDELRIRGCRHLKEVTAWCQSVNEVTTSALRAGHLPLLIGGDHSLAIGSILAVKSYCDEHHVPLSVIWLDAHADFNTHETTPTGNIHGMPLAVVCGDGPAELVAIGSNCDVLSVSAVTLVGLRSVDEEEQRRVHSSKLTVFTMQEIRAQGILSIMTQALGPVMNRGGHLHLSFDVDFLDPSVAPGVGTRVPEGPSLSDAELCLSMIADTGLLASLDVVELNPVFDQGVRTSISVVSLLRTLLSPQQAFAQPIPNTPALIADVDDA